MRYARIALLSAAATGLLPFATPAIARVSLAELGHPSGCFMCAPVTVNSWGTRGYSYPSVPLIGPELEFGVPPGSAALADEPGVAGPSHANRRHVEVRGHTGRYPPRYTAVRP